MNLGASIPRLLSTLIVLLLCTATTYSPLFAQIAPAPAQTTPAAENSWSMAGANPQRTSWVADAVNPAATADLGVLWYRPIEAYIPQNVQLIAGRGKIYLATARGLYALDANTGETAWHYDTELPLGNSPTLAGDTVFVGGYDRRLHALDTDSGAVHWQFTGAGAGYSTNPLVVEGRVLLGNRDGYFYALDAATGALQWQYPAAGQPLWAPILYSAAYADGVLYFAANDQYAYALDAATGALKWKAGPMPGDGYQA